MNIRVSEHQTVPALVQDVPQPVRRGWVLPAILGVVAVVILGFILYSIFGGSKPKPPPPPPVIVQQVARKDIAVVDHTIGTVVSTATVQVTARVQGQLLKAYFTEGQMVHTGDLLFQIDPAPYQAALDSATASLASAKAKAERYARLLALKAVAPQDADDAKAAYLMAVAAADTARLNLGYTQIRSPINGKTGAILIQPGNQIVASAGITSSTSTTTTTTALVTITQLQPIKISFDLPQADLPRIQKRMGTQGMQVALTQQGSTDAPLTATADFVGNEVDPKSGTVELRATFGNENNTLVPGQLVDVGVVLDSLKGATVVPHDAVNLGPSTSFLYIVRGGKAVMVPVTVLHDDGTDAAVQGKIKPGDMVVTDGQLKVVPGKPVAITKTPPQKK
ncbi:MAG TPA: efflux RND transporter periplasmic adaptor subunit [Rhizomicrobium sp.]|jgi:multidrug efflux system membrane fusion protein|nr:efflux RND transporter periplasmic adaptor subunit [Rhizomicrobium sp.]